MISQSELKYYLKLDDTSLEAGQITDRDEFLNTCIEFGISELDSAIGRRLARTDYIEKVISNNSNSGIYLKNSPIISVSSLKYWSGDTYADVLSSPDTIENSVEILDSFLLMRNNNAVAGKDVKVEYTAGYIFEVISGTSSGTIGTKNITGIGTAFDTELSVGDQLIFGGEIRTVSVKTDATHIVLDRNLSKTYSGVTVYRNTYPGDLRKGCMQLAAYHFLESRQGESSLNKSSASANLGGAVGDSYKKIDLSKLINQYRYINI